MSYYRTKSDVSALLLLLWDQIEQQVQSFAETTQEQFKNLEKMAEYEQKNSRPKKEND